MDKFVLKYLGTGAAEAVPGIFCNCANCKKAQISGGKDVRLRSSAIVNGQILIDLSPDFACFKSKYNLDTSSLSTVLITHTHQDHFNINLLSYNCSSFSNKPQKLNFYMSSYAARKLKKANIEKKNEAMENITVTEVQPYQTYTEGGYKIVPLEAAHNAPRSLIYLITYNGITLLYGNDTGMLSKQALKYLQNVKMDIVSFDGTMGLSKGQYNRHMGFEEIINIKEYFIKNGCCNEDAVFLITHFSHFIGLTHSEMEEYLKPHNIIPAYDGLEIRK